MAALTKEQFHQMVKALQDVTKRPEWPATAVPFVLVVDEEGSLYISSPVPDETQKQIVTAAFLSFVTVAPCDYEARIRDGQVVPGSEKFEKEDPGAEPPQDVSDLSKIN